MKDMVDKLIIIEDDKFPIEPKTTTDRHVMANWLSKEQHFLDAVVPVKHEPFINADEYVAYINHCKGYLVEDAIYYF